MPLQVAYNPRLLLTYSKITSEARVMVQDSSAFARPGEALTWAGLHARAALVDQVWLSPYHHAHAFISSIIFISSSLACILFNAFIVSCHQQNVALLDIAAGSHAVWSTAHVLLVAEVARRDMRRKCRRTMDGQVHPRALPIPTWLHSICTFVNRPCGDAGIAGLL